MYSLTLILQYIAEFFTVLGVIILIISGIKSFIKLMKIELLKNSNIDFDELKLYFASRIIFALDFFIAADLIKCVTEPDITRLATLAIIVAIRTITSYSLNKEINSTMEIKDLNE